MELLIYAKTKNGKIAIMEKRKLIKYITSLVAYLNNKMRLEISEGRCHTTALSDDRDHLWRGMEAAIQSRAKCQFETFIFGSER